MTDFPNSLNSVAQMVTSNPEINMWEHTRGHGGARSGGTTRIITPR